MFANYENRLSQSNNNFWISRYVNLNNLLHWHTEFELIYIVKGKADIMINNSYYDADTGDAFLCEENSLHFIHGKPDSIIDVLIFNKNIVSDFLNISLENPKLEFASEIQNMMQIIKSEIIQKDIFYKNKIESIILQQIIDIYRTEKTVSKTDNYIETSMFAELLQKINEEYSTFTFEKAAEFIGYSNSYFSRVFKKLSGISFTEYLNKIKIENAILMLQNSEALYKTSICEIAISCGFSTIRNFNRVFKNITGYSPKNLPKDFVLNEEIRIHTSKSFDPTKPESKLIE